MGAQDVHFLVVEGLELVVLGLELVALLLHLQGKVASEAREPDEPEGRRRVDRGTLAPAGAARSERDVLRVKPLLLGEGRGRLSGDGKSVLQVESAHRRRDV